MVHDHGLRRPGEHLGDGLVVAGGQKQARPVGAFAFQRAAVAVFGSGQHDDGIGLADGAFHLGKRDALFRGQAPAEEAGGLALAERVLDGDGIFLFGGQRNLAVTGGGREPARPVVHHGLAVHENAGAGLGVGAGAEHIGAGFGRDDLGFPADGEGARLNLLDGCVHLPVDVQGALEACRGGGAGKRLVREVAGFPGADGHALVLGLRVEGVDGALGEGRELGVLVVQRQRDVDDSNRAAEAVRDALQRDDFIRRLAFRAPAAIAVLGDSALAHDDDRLHAVRIERKNALAVLEQDGAVLGHAAGEGLVFLRVDAARIAGAAVEEADLGHHIQDVKNHVVDGRLLDRAVFEGLQQRLWLKEVDLIARIHLDIGAAVRTFDGVVQAAPVGHDEALEAPGFAQDIAVEVRVLATELGLADAGNGQLVVGVHYG